MMFPTLPQASTSSGGPAFNAQHTPYEALGGDAAVRGLVDAFYDAMHREPRFATIRKLHQADLTDARQKLYEFLSGWLGGPQLYIEKYGHPRLRARHLPFSISEAERDQWLACMTAAMNLRGISGEIRTFLDARFTHVADFLRNQVR
jgi:hemoglobin